MCLLLIVRHNVSEGRERPLSGCSLQRGTKTWGSRDHKRERIISTLQKHNTRLTTLDTRTICWTPNNINIIRIHRLTTMEPPTAFEFPARESSPLHPLSPQRVNRRPASTATSRSSYKTSETDSQDEPAAQLSPTRKANLFAEYNPITRTPSPSKEVFGGGVQQSPSMPDMTSLRSHGRTNSDVQVLVKRFEHLDVRDRDAEGEARRKKHEMELRRAQLGREEAESELKKWREECRRIAEDLKESKHRESKVSNRLEKVMVCCVRLPIIQGTFGTNTL